MREIVGRGPALRARGALPRGGARACFADQPYKREIIEGESTSAEGALGRPRSSRVPQRRLVRRPLPRPARPDTSELGAFKLMQRGRGLLARRREARRCCSASTAPPGRPRRPSTSTSTGWRRRSGATTAARRGARPVLASPTSSAAGWPSGTPRAAMVRKLMEDYSGAEHERGGYQFVVTPHLGQVDAVRDPRAPRAATPTACTRRWRWRARRYYPKPMNCPFHMPDLPVADPVVPRAAAAAVRVRDRVPLRALRRAPRPARVRGFTQDDATSSAPDQIVRRADQSLLAFVLRPAARPSASSEFEAELSTRPEQVRRRPTRTGTRPTAALRDALEAAGPALRGRRGRRRLLRPQDRRARPRRHRAALAALHPPGRLPPPAPLRARVHRRRQRQRTGRS